MGDIISAFIAAIAANQQAQEASYSQEKANEAYLTGVRETNEQNYKIWQEEKQHNIDMFNMENEASISNWQNQFDQTNAYNSPLAQRQRLEQAGLNPSLMMSNGSTGVASSSGIPQARVNPSHAPTMQAPNQVTPSGVVKAQQQMASMLSFAQSLSATSDANLKGVTAEGADNLNKINKKYGDFMAWLTMRDAEENVKQKEQQNYLNKQIQDDLIKTYRAQRVLAELKADDAKIINKYLDDNQQLSLAKLAEEVNYMIAQTNMTNEKAEEIRASRFYIWAQAQGVAIDNKFKKETNDYRKNILYYETDSKFMSTDVQYREWTNLKRCWDVISQTTWNNIVADNYDSYYRREYFYKPSYQKQRYYNLAGKQPSKSSQSFDTYFGIPGFAEIDYKGVHEDYYY